MLEISKTTSAPQQKGHFILCFAKSKVGKTYALKTLKGKTLVIDTDEGISSLGSADNIDFVTVVEKTTNIIKEMQEVFQIIDKNIDKYDNFVLDTLTQLSKMYLDVHLVGTKDGRQAYAMLSTSLYPIVRKFETLARHKGKNVIFTAQAEVVLDENDKETIAPSIDGQKFLTKVVMPRFDGIIALEADAMQKRWFITRPTGKVWAGIRDPNNKVLPREEANYEKLFEKLDK